MKTILYIFAAACIVLSIQACNDDPIILPCIIAGDHFNNGGAAIGELDGNNFLGECVFTFNTDSSSVNIFISRFSVDQCYRSDLITLPQIGIVLLDTTYLNSNTAIDFQQTDSENTVITDKKIDSEKPSWIIVQEINMEKTELRGEFFFNFVDDATVAGDTIGRSTFSNGQFFSERRD